jgi:hypothetical protein
MIQRGPLGNCLPIKVSFPFLLTVLLYTGCGIHFHRPEDAKVAQSAVDAFKDAKLNETITAEFAASAEILTQEIAAIRRQSNARREQWLAAFIGGQTKNKSWDGLSKYIADRTTELAGQNADKDPMKQAITDMLAAPENIHQAFEDLRGTYLSYDAARTSIVPVKDPKIPRIGAKLTDDEAAKLSPTVKQVYDLYMRDLAKYTTAVQKASPPPAIKGLIGETLSSQTAQAKALEQIGATAKTTQKRLDDLQKARDAKIAEANDPKKKADEVKQALKEATVKTDEAKTYLKQITSVTSQAGLPDIQKKISGLEAIRQEITDLLKSLSDTLEEKAPTSEDKEKIKLLASVSAIRAGVDAAKYPKVSDLLLESERLRIEIQRLQGLIALEQERKTVLDLKLAALMRELGALRRAQGRVRQAAGTTKAIVEEDGATAEIAVDALAYVAESWTTGRTPAEEADFLLAGIDHRGALENSSAAFAQWANLIGVPLSQLLAYHQSGIRSEDLANLINAAGLGAIAGGVY